MAQEFAMLYMLYDTLITMAHTRAQLSGSGAQLSGSGAQLSAISAYLHTSYLGAHAVVRQPYLFDQLGT